jgi:hypothetical protein
VAFFHLFASVGITTGRPGETPRELKNSHLLDRHNYLRLGHFALNALPGRREHLVLKSFANHLQALLARTLLSQTEPAGFIWPLAFSHRI